MPACDGRSTVRHIATCGDRACVWFAFGLSIARHPRHGPRHAAAATASSSARMAGSFGRTVMDGQAVRYRDEPRTGFRRRFVANLLKLLSIDSQL